MLTKPIRGLDIVPTKGSAFSIETPRDLPRAHQLMCAVGARGMGKTVCVTNFIKMMPFDYTIAVSPTLGSNKELLKKINIQHTFPDPDDETVIPSIRAIIEQEAADLDEYNTKMAKYKRMFESKRPSPIFEDADLLDFWNGRDFEKPKHKWGGRKPIIAVLFDDVLGSKLFQKPRPLNQFVSFHRHLGALETMPGAIGCSCFFLVQSYTSQPGLPRTVRNNCTSFILFKSHNQKELDQIASELAGEIPKSKFLKAYNEALKDKHDFLFVDLFSKIHFPSIFRRNFNQFILV